MTMEKNRSSNRENKILLNSSKQYIVVISAITTLFAIIYLILTSFLFESWFKENIVYAQFGPFSPYFFSLAMVMLFFGLLLFYRAFKFGLTSLVFLLIGLFSSMTSYLFGWANWNPAGSVPQTWLYEVQLLTSTLSLYFFFFHFELNDRESPRPWLTILITICLIPYCLKNVYSIISMDYGISSTFQILLRTLVQIGAIVIFLSVLLIGIRMSIAFFKHSKRARILGGMQFSGIVLLFINVIFEFTEGIIDALGVDFSTYNTPIFVVAILLISIPHFIDPELIGLVPPNVQAVSLVDEFGITHYYKPLADEFSDFEESGATSQLIGGLTIAFANVGEEVAKSKAGIDSLKFGDRAIIVEFLKPYYLVIIAQKGTYFLQLEMREYVKQLKKLYKEPPKDGSLIPEEVFKDLNKEFFPILTPYYWSNEEIL
ncbi:MAG: hypothetical protein EU548_02315 [Promethearchaeota archaeon]|nr:MAG: hypothetical protein EU548_02315 [Candidatus Lokiarchaeota archaeon]